MITSLIEDRKFSSKNEMIDFLRKQQKVSFDKSLIQKTIKEARYFEGRATAFALAADLLEMSDF